MIQRRTVGIVGTGNVGTAAVYAMFNQGLASELLVLDQDTRRAEGEAMDLMHGQQLVGRITCRAVDYPALSNAQIVVLSAGASQRAPTNRGSTCFGEMPTFSARPSFRSTNTRPRPFSWWPPTRSTYSRSSARS